MTALILRALTRAGQAINNPFSMDGRYVVPQRGDSGRDFIKITVDMRKVGRDMKKVSAEELKKHGR